MSHTQSAPVSVSQAAAQYLTTIANRTPQEELYDEAVRIYIQERGRDKIPEAVLQLLESKSSLDELKADVDKARVDVQKCQGKSKRRTLALVQGTVDTLERFDKAIDVMVNANSLMMAPIWGCMRVLLVLVKSVQNVYEKVVEISERTKRCLQLFDEYTKHFKLEGLFKDRLRDFYGIVVEWSVEASVACGISWTDIAIGTLKINKPMDSPLERLSRKLEEYSRDVKDAADMEKFKSSLYNLNHLIKDLFAYEKAAKLAFQMSTVTAAPPPGQYSNSPSAPVLSNGQGTPPVSTQTSLAPIATASSLPAPYVSLNTNGTIPSALAPNSIPPQAAAGAVSGMQSIPTQPSTTRQLTYGQAAPPRNGIFFVPNLASSTFVGRTELLRDLNLAMKPHSQDPGLRRAAVYGLPGLGKSQVALQYANRYWSNHRSVFFAYGHSESQLQNAYAEFAQRLKLSESVRAPENKHLSVDAFKAWLESNEGWLLVVDNVETAVVARKFLPTVGRGSILITTRDRFVAEQLAPEQSFELRVLPSDKAISLTCRVLGWDHFEFYGSDEMATRIYSLTGGIPLVLEQLAALARQRGPGGLSTVVRDLEKRREDALGQPSNILLHETHSSAAELYAMAFEELGKRSKAALALLDTMVFLDTSLIPISLLERGIAGLPKWLARKDTYYRVVAANDTEADILKQNLQLTKAWKPKGKRNGAKYVAQHIFDSARSAWKNDNAGPVETSLDSAVRAHIADAEKSYQMLSSPEYQKVAIATLVSSGLVRVAGPAYLSIHDLVRDLRRQKLEKDMQKYKVRSLFSMLLVFLAFPVIDLLPFKTWDLSQAYHPHTLSVLHYTSAYALDSVIGPELMHIVASVYALRSRISQRDPDKDPWRTSIEWYQQAFDGYITVLELEKKMKTWAAVRFDAYQDVPVGYQGHIYDIMAIYFGRYGQAGLRAYGTASKIADILHEKRQLSESLVWRKKAINGYVSLLGPYNFILTNPYRDQLKTYAMISNWRAALEPALKTIQIYQYWGDDIYGDGFSQNFPAAIVACIYERLGDYETALTWAEPSFGYGNKTDWLFNEVSFHLKLQSRLNRKLCRYEIAERLAAEAVEKQGRAYEHRGRDEPDWTDKYTVDLARYEHALALEALGRRRDALAALQEPYTDMVQTALRVDDHDIHLLAKKFAWNIVRLCDMLGEPVNLVNEGILSEAEGLFSSPSGWLERVPSPFILPTDLRYVGELILDGSEEHCARNKG